MLENCSQLTGGQCWKTTARRSAMVWENRGRVSNGAGKARWAMVQENLGGSAMVLENHDEMGTRWQVLVRENHR